MNFNHETILVVDDSAETLSFINDVLEQAGMDVLVALEGKQALTIASQIRPDMILLDAMMPAMDGFSTCEQLKSSALLADIPVIFMTGLSQTQDIIRGLEAGGVDYLTKPIEPDELLARMRVHLNNAKRAASAQTALDTTGQHLLTVNRLGRLTWATPLAQQKLAPLLEDPIMLSSLSAKLIQWQSTEPNVGATLEQKFADVTIGFDYQGQTPQNEMLLRLIDLSEDQGPKKLKDRLELITERESEVLYWLANGKTNREIALILSVSPRTVNKHLELLFPKLGVENRTAAAAIALKILSI
ncbi:response regulator [Celerinatantimonas sp. MCCC 1A17872]|uniref:response regulator n=1 Tax=Celerinatantimonas sp. MCCC 1A17872 TaxID=3177514 RepID=UPI0038CC1E08